MSSGWVLLVFVGLRVLTAVLNSSGTSGVPKTRWRPRVLTWVALVAGWGFVALMTLASFLVIISPGPVKPDMLERFVFGAPVVALGACVLFALWPILRAIARRGHPKLVYHLARAGLLFPSTGETESGACLLGALALAHRGKVQPEELDFFAKRLARERVFFGTYGTAAGLLELLAARCARDAGNEADARERAARGRALLGTVTYVSERAIPKPVRKVAWEILALDSAARGEWGGLRIVKDEHATPLVKELRRWEGLLAGDKEEPPKRSIESPAVDALFARSLEPSPPLDAEQAWRLARRRLGAVMRGETIGPLVLLELLTMLDYFLHPKAQETRLPEAARDDEELAAAVHDSVAAMLLPAFERQRVPLYALRTYGPISARVATHVETLVTDAMDREAERLRERLRRGEELDGSNEWLDASRVRAAYRTVGVVLGPSGALREWPRFCEVYGKLGVELANERVDMKPLAYAIFNCLARDAETFEDEAVLRQQRHNMKVTAGTD